MQRYILAFRMMIEMGWSFVKEVAWALTVGIAKKILKRIGG